eukprot:452808_1
MHIYGILAIVIIFHGLMHQLQMNGYIQDGNQEYMIKIFLHIQLLLLMIIKKNKNLNELLNILSNKYGNSNTYPQAWLTDKYMNPASTWSEPFIKPTHTTSAPSSNTTTPTAPATTANPTEFFTTNRRRNLLQIEEENPYCNINPLADSTSSYNASFI